MKTESVAAPVMGTAAELGRCLKKDEKLRIGSFGTTAAVAADFEQNHGVVRSR